MNTITSATFEEFKAYARELLNDFTQGQVRPYINNPALQEVVVTWGAEAKKGMTENYPKPENLTVLEKEPKIDPVEAGGYDVRSLVKTFMEAAGFTQTPEMSSIAAMKPGRFDVKVGETYDKETLLSKIDVLTIRANGDLGKALRDMRKMSDNKLDTLARAALKKVNILVKSGPA